MNSQLLPQSQTPGKTWPTISAAASTDSKQQCDGANDLPLASSVQLDIQNATTTGPEDQPKGR